jgi:AcrR family transcriptional regulator
MDGEMTTEDRKSGDLRRSLDLLWGLDEPSNRGPKRGLSLERIVATAVAVADADGLEALSMRRVAGELGVGAMSLYRYVPGKAELIDLMRDAVNKMDDTGRFDASLGWRALLERIARWTWQLCVAHPWVLQVDRARPLLGPNALDGLEVAIGCLRDVRLSDREKFTLLVAVDGFVTGVARTHLNAVRPGRPPGMSDAEFWTTQSSSLHRAMESGRYPRLASLGPAAFSNSAEDIFDFGLQRFLDGVAAFLATRAGQGPEPGG